MAFFFLSCSVGDMGGGWASTVSFSFVMEFRFRDYQFLIILLMLNVFSFLNISVKC